MNRVLSLLLIPMFVLGHALPHSHAGTGVAESDDHASRPHVHLSIGHSHHHGDDHGGDHDKHDDDLAGNVADSHGNTGYSLPRQHDDDAIYVGQNIASFARTAGSQHVDLSDCGWPGAYRLDQRASPKVVWPAEPDRYAGLPIYLLVASLRL